MASTRKLTTCDMRDKQCNFTLWQAHGNCFLMYDDYGKICNLWQVRATSQHEESAGILIMCGKGGKLVTYGKLGKLVTYSKASKGGKLVNLWQIA